MHECIKKLLIFQGSPDKEELECLCKLMNTVGEWLDHVKLNQHEQIESTQIDYAKAKKHVIKYFIYYFYRHHKLSKIITLN